MPKAVKYLHSALTGAPTLSGTAGHLIAVLDACLINGFGSGTVDSVSVSSGVATVTRAAGHPFELDTAVELAGATGSYTGLNGQFEVTATTSTTYTFACPGVPDGSATGTITHKLAALGWTKEFSGTNLAAYKSPNVASTACRLRVDDTGTTTARVVGYETMSDVNTGTGPFPTSAQQSGGLFWSKSNAADTTARPWALIGDDRMFYLWVGYQSTSGTASLLVAFGDFPSKKSPDAYAAFISGTTTALTSNSQSSQDLLQCQSAAAAGSYIARSYTAIGSAVQAQRSPLPAMGTGVGAISGQTGTDYPNLADNGLYVTPYYVGEDGSVQVLRGIFPGAYFCPMVGLVSGGVSHRDRITGITGLSGKALRAIVNPINSGVFFFEVTGPWR